MKAKDIVKQIRKAGENPSHAAIREHERLIKEYAEKALESVQKELDLYRQKDWSKDDPFREAKRNLK